MTAPTVPPSDELVPIETTVRRRAGGPLLAAVALAAVAGAATLAWFGGPAASAGVVVLAAAGWQLRAILDRRDPQAPVHSPEETTSADPSMGGRVGAEVMVAQVVPVWSRQMEVTRDVATDGLARLLESFTGISGALETLSTQLQGFNPVAAPGAIDEAVQVQSPALEALLAPSARAFRERDDIVAVLVRCSDALNELQLQAKAAHEISRHTRLVAFNASIEAQRAGAAGSGTQAVAKELRDLSARMAATGEAVNRLVSSLGQAVNAARRSGELHDTADDELRLELQIKARDALTALLGGVGASLSGSREIQEASGQLKEQIDEAFVHFQFGDRLAQMMSIVGNDMTNFAAWVSRHPHATQTDAAEWLEALDASYTMEEQRAHHHGNVHVDRGSEVEFF